MMLNSLSRVTWQGTMFCVLMLWSFGTTGVGLTTMIAGFEPLPRYGVAFLGSALVQLAIGALWRSAARAVGSRALIGALVYGLSGLFASTVSGSFASSANVWIYNSAYVDDFSARKDRAPVLLPVVAVTEQSTALSAKMDEFSDFASARAEREASHGDSCEGQTLAAKCGPICRLRKQQAEKASALAGMGRDLRQDAIALRASAGGQTSQAEINALFEKASRLSNDPRRGEMRSWVSRQIKGFESGFANGKETILCRDTEAVGKLSAMLALLETTASVPMTPPTVRKPTVMLVAERNMELLGQVLAATVAGAEAFLRQLRQPDVLEFLPFWIFSAFVEMGCAMLAMRAVFISNDWRGMDTRLLSERDLGRLGSKTKSRTAQVLRTVRELTIWQGDERFFLTPADGPSDVVEEAENLAHILGLGQPRLRQPLDIDEIAPEEAERLKDATGAQYFRVWLVPKNDRFERELARKLGLREVPFLGSGSDPDPGTGPALVYSQ